MLNQLKSIKLKKNKKRIGRGYGSGKGGHTVGRGQKGQKSRSGYKQPRPGFEGGAMPLARRIPKLKGFSRAFLKAKKRKILISLTDLDKTFKANSKITLQSLIDSKLIKSKSKKIDLKILANGKLTKKLNVEGIKVSDKARKAIEKLGGSVK